MLAWHTSARLMLIEHIVASKHSHSTFPAASHICLLAHTFQFSNYTSPIIIIHRNAIAATAAKNISSKSNPWVSSASLFLMMLHVTKGLQISNLSPRVTHGNDLQYLSIKFPPLDASRAFLQSILHHLFVLVFVFLFFDGLFGHLTTYASGCSPGHSRYASLINPLNWLITLQTLKVLTGKANREKMLRQIFLRLSTYFTPMHHAAIFFFCSTVAEITRSRRSEVVTPSSKLGEIDHARGDSERENKKRERQNS